MLQAVGCKTRKVYAEGEYKHDVMRKLNKEFPYHKKKNRNQMVIDKPVYPEPILLRRGD